MVEDSGRGRSALRSNLLEIVRSRGYRRSETPFALSSGGTSHDYVDLRRAVSDGADLRLAAEAVLEFCGENDLDFDAIGGMTMGADPVAHAVAVVSGRGWYSVRKAEKTHGTGQRIEGAAVGPGVRAIVFEDTTSTGRSLLDALDVVVASGATVVGALTLLDRGADTAAAFASTGCRLFSLLTYAGFRDRTDRRVRGGHLVHLLDWVIVVIALLAAFHGFHVGAVSQILSFAGFLLGLTGGVAILLAVEPEIHAAGAKTVVAILLLVIPGSLVGTLGRRLADLIWPVLRRLHIGVVDSFVGSVIAVAGTLVCCWLFASILVNSAVTAVSQAVSASVIIRGVERAMPPVPDAFAAVERYITRNGFPDALINVVPESPGPVALPSAATIVAGVDRAGPSVVKVEALGCGDQQEGSGFVTTDGLVVTNAHVIAGTSTITVVSRDGQTVSATPISFDPKLDLAVLRPAGPVGVSSLTISTNFISRGDPAIVLGYPGGGPFAARPAGVLSRFEAQGRDIYDESVTNRIVYEIDSIVRPGNSGGPLVTESGLVVGVVFSRSSTNPDVGFALASPAVAQEVDAATGLRARVGTGGVRRLTADDM